ncbi:MAG: hypothetical protein IKI35_05625 [Stomatobaculum sp.]|nr:hypothetical protein [Stomatobaculum sp.]MBR7058188.1 hypothetical protein [Stomatobaculum sp.]
MPREKPEYRDNYEALREFSNGRMMLTAAEVARYLGRDPRTVKKLYDIPREGITIPTLARRMCG